MTYVIPTDEVLYQDFSKKIKYSEFKKCWILTHMDVIDVLIKYKIPVEQRGEIFVKATQFQNRKNNQ